MLQIIEELEVILNETSILRQNLDTICENIWCLLSPPGKNGCGTFIFQNTCNKSNNKPSSTVTSEHKDLYLLDDVLGNVSDLIAYGKQIRETATLENKKKIRKGNVEANPVDHVVSNRPLIRSNVHQEFRTTDSRCKLNVKQKSATTQDSSGNLVQMKRNSNNYNERDDQKLTVGYESANKDISDKFLHSCSMNLTDTISSLGIPSDVHYLLQLYHNFQNRKVTKNLDADTFSEKFYNHVKLKLECDLKNNIKEEGRYVKYLDIADGIYKSQEDKLFLDRLQNSGIQYKSKDQLSLFEARYQCLMELQLKERLINQLNNII